MRDDTRELSDLPLIASHYNTAKQADPFLIQLSIGNKPVAGSGVKNLRQQRGSNAEAAKRILALNQEDMQKMRACEEMIQFEK